MSHRRDELRPERWVCPKLGCSTTRKGTVSAAKGSENTTERQSHLMRTAQRSTRRAPCRAASAPSQRWPPGRPGLPPRPRPAPQPRRSSAEEELSQRGSARGLQQRTNRQRKHAVSTMETQRKAEQRKKSRWARAAGYGVIHREKGESNRRAEGIVEQGRASRAQQHSSRRGAEGHTGQPAQQRARGQAECCTSARCLAAAVSSDSIRLETLTPPTLISNLRQHHTRRHESLTSEPTSE